MFAPSEEIVPGTIYPLLPLFSGNLMWIVEFEKNNFANFTNDILPKITYVSATNETQEKMFQFLNESANW